MRELGKLARGLRQRDTVADEDDGPLRFENEIDARCYFVGRGAAALRIERRRRRRYLDVILFLEDVEGHVDVHRTRASRQHSRRRLTQGERQHVHARRLETALDHRPDDVREIGLEVRVDFLKWAAVELRGRHIRRDRE